MNANGQNLYPIRIEGGRSTVLRLTCFEMGDMGLSRLIVSTVAISCLPKVKVVGLSGAETVSGVSCTSIDSSIRGGGSYVSIFTFIAASFSSCSSCSTGWLGWQITAASSSSAFSITIGSWRDAAQRYSYFSCIPKRAPRLGHEFCNATFYANRRATPVDQGFSNFRDLCPPFFLPFDGYTKYYYRRMCAIIETIIGDVSCKYQFQGWRKFLCNFSGNSLFWLGRYYS